MKKVLSVALMLIGSPLFAGKLTTFKEITAYLESGKEISVVVQDKLCKMIDPNTPKIPESTMVIKPTSVMFTENLLGFDAVKFSSTPWFSAFPNGILQRATFGMNDSGQVSIRIAFFDVETNKKSPEVNDVRILCQLGEGVSVYQN